MSGEDRQSGDFLLSLCPVSSYSITTFSEFLKKDKVNVVVLIYTLFS